MTLELCLAALRTETDVAVREELWGVIRDLRETDLKKKSC